jgi:hypothetical protein
MVRMRVYGILADYEDQNDHSTLRKDPVFKLIACRAPDDSDLASQSTLSRFENAIDIINRQRDVFLDAFIASFESPPARLTLDIDPFDDPTHGRQQLTFFHGYYEQHQYQPRVVRRERPSGHGVPAEPAVGAMQFSSYPGENVLDLFAGAARL